MKILVKWTWLLLCFASGLECATRIDELVRFGTPLLSMTTSVADIVAVDSSGAHGVPGTSYRQFSINSQGMRGPEPSGAKNSVLIMGASETFGLYESAGKEFPRQLQDSLAKAGCIVDVLNAGLPGFSLATIAYSFQHRLNAMMPATVVLYPTPVQYLDEFKPNFVAPNVAVRVTPATLELRVVRRIRDHIKQIMPARLQTYLRQKEIDALLDRHPEGWRFESIPEDRMTAFRRDLVGVVVAARARGADVVVATHANAFSGRAVRDSTQLVAWAKFYPRAKPQLLVDFDSVANGYIREGGLTGQYRASDVAAAVAERGSKDYFADFSHFTNIGAGVVAGELKRQVLRTKACTE